MNKLLTYVVLVLALAIIAFGTWQFFQGNLAAAFSTLPFLLIMYLFVKPQQ
ncbi:MAG TPA: hypothetical protein VL949_07755 [Geobacteraceae bacterium]|jgi:hypothetical protein|nr:hypothetical protein [Geobacteraceae bacterium]